MISYTVHLVKLPPNVHETVTLNEDDTYTVFLDKGMTYEAQRDRLIHALKHLYRNDFDKFDVQEIEYESHKP